MIKSGFCIAQLGAAILISSMQCAAEERNKLNVRIAESSKPSSNFRQRVARGPIEQVEDVFPLPIAACHGRVLVQHVFDPGDQFKLVAVVVTQCAASESEVAAAIRVDFQQRRTHASLPSPIELAAAPILQPNIDVRNTPGVVSSIAAQNTLPPSTARNRRREQE